MADYTAFVEAGTALEALLRDHLTPEPLGDRELIGLGSPHESENRQLTLYLYHIEEDSPNLSAGYYQADRDLQRIRPARFTLRYLITAHSKAPGQLKEADQHRILGAAIQTLRDLHDPTPFIRGIVAELGPERKEIEYEQPRRRAGKTHNNWYSLFDAAMLSFTSYTKVGMRIAEFFGFGIAFLSFLIGLFYLIAKLVAWDSFVPGYAPTMIAVFFMGGVQLAFLGFLGEYIMAMNTRIMNRPLVVEEERLNFDDQNPQEQ